MNNSKELKLGMLLSYAGMIFSTLTNFLYIPLFIKVLGQDLYGVYGLVNSTIGYFTVIDFGFGNAIIRYTAKYNAEKRFEELSSLYGLFTIVFSVISLLVFLLGAIFTVLAPFLFSNSLNTELITDFRICLIISTLNLALSFSLGRFNYILIGNQHFIYTKFMTLVKPVLLCGLFFIFLLNGFGLKTIYIIIFCVNLFIYSVDFIVYKLEVKINFSFRNLDFKLLKNIFFYSFWIFLGNFVNQLWWSSGQILLGIYATTYEIAIFTLAMQLRTVFQSLSVSCNNILLPKITDLTVSDKSNVYSFEKRISTFLFFLLALVLSGFILFGKEFIGFWAGKDYEDCYTICILLFSILLIPYSQAPFQSHLQAENKHKFRALFYTVLAVINLIVTVFTVQKWGIWGIIIPTSITILVGNVFGINLYYYFNMNLDIPDFFVSLIKPCVFVLGITIVSWFIVKLFIPLSIIKMIICIFAYTLLYCLSCLVLFFKETVKVFRKK